MATEDHSKDFADFLRILRSRYLQTDAADFETCFGHVARVCDTFGLWKPNEEEAKRALLQDLQTDAIDLSKAIARLFHESARKQGGDASAEEAVSPFDNILDTEEIASLRKRRRKLLVERSQKALQLIERIVLARLAQDDDPALDALAEDFADLIFGEFSKDV